MKYLIKGTGLGLSLIVANRICELLVGWSDRGVLLGGVVYFLITVVFLVSYKVRQLLATGFVGLAVMFGVEIIILITGITDFLCFPVYWGGLFGSMTALIVSIILTVKKVKLSRILFREGRLMSNELSKESKIELLLYGAISAISFAGLVTPQNAGISVPIFVLIQFVCLWFVVPDKKRLWFLVPVFVMSMNCVLSASHIWRVSNLIVSILMYGCMFTELSFKKDSLAYFGEVAERVMTPFGKFDLPFKWTLEFNGEKAPVIKRVALALAIALPCAALLVLVLANADMVFLVKTDEFFSSFFEMLKFNTIFKAVCGLVVGLFLFGIVYNAHQKQEKQAYPFSPIKGDMLIINILLFVVLIVYTLFVIVQFKYLFAGSALPYGLNYTEYARKGFFELLWLTGANLAAILIVVRLTKNLEGKATMLTKALCHYLCAVTVVLLASSFYRMLLYTWDDGLTRLRFFVMGFLIFEAVGLVITFVYIAKPRFNITLVYVTIALAYYMVLNVVPADNIIAKNQVDKYLQGGRDGLHYVFTLSADAAPAVEYLYKNTDDVGMQNAAKRFLEDKTYSDIPQRWQRYNLSQQRAKNILEDIK